MAAKLHILEHDVREKYVLPCVAEVTEVNYVAILHHRSMLNSKLIVINLNSRVLGPTAKLKMATKIHIWEKGVWIGYVLSCEIEVNSESILHNSNILNSNYEL
jgi:hypothetical protein